MQQCDKKKFSEMLFATFEIYGEQPSKLSVDMFWRVLDRFTIVQVEHGLKAHLNDTEAGRFKPKPADIIRHIEGNRQDRLDRASFAWQRFIDSLELHGTYRSVVYDDPAIHYAITLTFGSWVKAGEMIEDEMPFRRNDFIQAYAAYRNGTPFPAILSGMHERDNVASGLRYEKVSYIGDKDKCKAVESGGTQGGIESLHKKLTDVKALV